MKTFKYLLLAFLSAFVFAGCEDDVTYDRGGDEDPNSYGVFFPTQAKATDLELDPADPMEVELTIARTNDTEAITVPVVVTSNVEGIFTVEPITFDAGQPQRTFKVTFPNAEIGTTYKCNIRVADPAYAQIYGEKATGIDFSITRVKWNLVTGKNGETKGKWRDDIISSIYGVPVKYAESDLIEIYERDDTKGYYRILDVYSPEYLSRFYPDYSAADLEENCTRGLYTYIDATDPTKVWLPEQSTGVTLNSGDGVIGYASMVKENGFNGTGYGTLVDGVITFPTQAILLSLDGEGWYYGNRTAMQRILFPGAQERDYSIAIDKSEPKDGKVALDVTIGADVSKVTYEIFEGSLSPTLANAKSNDMNSGLIATKELTKSTTLTVEMEETGLYTIVANVYDVDGVFNNFAYLPFGYIKAGDDMPVLLDMGIIVSDKYASQGYTAEDAVEFWANGQDIASGYYGLVETSSLAGMTEDEVAEILVEAGDEFTAEDIAQINAANGSFGMVFGGLMGGTDYTMLVLANNGYVSELFVAHATTEGEPQPLQRKYTIDDLYLVDKDVLFKTWNVWAVDLFDDNQSTKRQKMGQFTFSENTEDDTADVDAINLKGLSLGVIADDTVIWEYYNGVLYTLGAQPMGEFMSGDNKFYLSYGIVDPATGKGTGSDYAMVGGITEDGYIAFVTNNKSANLSGVWLRVFSDPEYANYIADLAIYYDLLLEDPAAAEPASMSKVSTGRLNDLAAKAFSEPQNYVELRGRERMRALIDEHVGRQGTAKPVVAGHEAMRTNFVAADAAVAKARVTETKPVSVPMDSIRKIGKKADVQLR